MWWFFFSIRLKLQLFLRIQYFNTFTKSKTCVKWNFWIWCFFFLRLNATYIKHSPQSFHLHTALMRAYKIDNHVKDLANNIRNDMTKIWTSGFSCVLRIALQKSMDLPRMSKVLRIARKSHGMLELLFVFTFKWHFLIHGSWLLHDIEFVYAYNLALI